MATKTLKTSGGDYSTWSAALADSATWDILEVYTGTWAESNLGLTVSNKTIRAASGQSPVVGTSWGKQTLTIADSVTNVTIEGIDFSPTSNLSYCINAAGNNSGLTVTNCKTRGSSSGIRLAGAQAGTITIQGCRHYDHAGAVIHSVACQDLRVIDCVVESGCSDLLTYADWGGYMWRCRAKSSTCCLFRCTTSQTTYYGTPIIDHCQAAYTGTSFAIYIVGRFDGAAGPYPTVQNCTLDGGGHSGTGIYCAVDRAGVVLRNNIVKHFAVGIQAGSAVTHDHNDVWSNTTNWLDGATAGPTDISSDPLLDASSVPTASSPCRNAGTSTTGGSSTDLAGVAFPQETTPDIGAYEYTPQNPRVVSLTPYDSTHSDVAFDLPMTTSGGFVAASNYPITATGGGVAMTVSSVSVQSSTVARLEHTEGTGGLEYTVTVSDQVLGATGYPVDQGHNTATMTGVSVPPQVVSAVCSVVAGLTVLDVLFGEAMGSSAWVAANYSILSLEDGVDVDVLGAAELSHHTARLTISEPTTGQGYRVTVDAAVADSADNAMDPDHRTADWYGQGIPPTITSASTRRVSGVPVIDVVYSEAVTGSRDASDYTLTDHLGYTVPIDAGYSPTTSTDVLVVSAMLQGMPYTLTASSAIYDLAGNAIEETTRSVQVIGPAADSVEVWRPAGLRITLDGTPLDLGDSPAMTLIHVDGEPDGARLVRWTWASLACDRVASEDDAMLLGDDDPVDLRGWWGDAYATTAGDRWGSRLWMLSRMRGDDAARWTESMIREALAWMIASGLVASVECTAAGSGDRMEARIVLTEPEGRSRAIGISWDVWEGLA